MTCYLELIESSKKYENKNSFYYFGSKTKMVKFIKHVDILASYFKSIGLKKGDTFTIFLPTNLNSFAAFYALNKIGVVANIVHPLIPINNLKKYTQDTKSKGIILLDILVNEQISELNDLNTHIIVSKNSDYVNGFKKVFFKIFELIKANKVKKLKNSINYNKIIRKFKKHTPAKTVKDTNLVATYVHSGGTSGETKTIMLSNKAIIELTHSVALIHPKETNRFSLIVLPLFHAYGLVASMHNSITQGYNCIAFPKFNATAINKSIKKHDVSIIIGVPLMFTKMLREKNFHSKHLQKLKAIYCGGDTVTNTLQTEFNETVQKFGGTARLLAGYGLTEVGSVCAVNTEKDYRFGSVGKALPNVNIEVWDENKKKLKAKEIGEIIISGPTIMDGYYNSKDNGIFEINGEKYILTGDLGFIDEDGFVFIIGRKKRLIKIAAYNIFPSQIEDEILKLPFIKDVCVIESKKEDKTIIKAVVSLKNTELTKYQIANHIYEHCQNNLIQHSIPKELEFVDELPRTKIGKIDFVKIINMFG